jgi:hypothetical protein
MPGWSALRWCFLKMNPVLLELWREKHPQGLEQFALNFEKCIESGQLVLLAVRFAPALLC